MFGPEFERMMVRALFLGAVVVFVAGILIGGFIAWLI